MSPMVFVPTPLHSCLEDNRFEVDLNRAEHVLGSIWRCPDYSKHWRYSLHSDGGMMRFARWASISDRTASKVMKSGQNVVGS